MNGWAQSKAPYASDYDWCRASSGKEAPSHGERIIMVQIDDILNRLEGVSTCGSGWRALCPAHPDKRPSLSIATGKDGRILMYCHAGCRLEHILGAIGLTMADLRGEGVSTSMSRNDKCWRIEATYPYRDENGLLLFEVVRYEPKDFRQRRPDGKGGWIWNLDGVRRVLYRLPELLAADPAQWVHVVEGEKDADAVRELAKELRVSPNTILQWARDGVIPRVKINSRVQRFILEDVIEALRQRTEDARRD